MIHFWGGGVTDPGEVAFEGGEAASGEGGYLFQGQVVHIVVFQEFQDIYFPGLGEIEEGGIEAFIGVEEGIDGFGHFQFNPLFVGLNGWVIVGPDRLEKALDVGAVGGQDEEAGFTSPGIAGDFIRLKFPVECMEEFPGEP